MELWRVEASSAFKRSEEHTSELQSPCLPTRRSSDLFEIIKDSTGTVTLNSGFQRTAWRFQMNVSAKSKQMSLSFTLDYSGLNVDQALRGANFYGALASGGELSIQEIGRAHV